MTNGKSGDIVQIAQNVLFVLKKVNMKTQIQEKWVGFENKIETPWREQLLFIFGKRFLERYLQQQITRFVLK